MSDVWVCDFEYRSMEGENPSPVCFVATEFNTGRTHRVWLDGVNNPVSPIDFKDPSITYVAYYAIAEMSCHLALGWDIPINIVDLFCEWRVYTNTGDRQPNGLIDACNHFNLPTIDVTYKTKMRNRILDVKQYNDVERNEILDYCNTDVVMTSALLKSMLPLIGDWNRVLFRGKYMFINSLMEHIGISLDVYTLNLLKDNWDIIKWELIKGINTEFDFFDGLTFKTDKFMEYLNSHQMSWLLTEKGNLSMEDETWKTMVQIYPQLQPVRDVRSLLGKFKKLHVTCGQDGRNRGMLSPFGTKTGRNAPKVSCIFTNPSWLRSLIKPQEGYGVSYLDFEQQEFMVAAVLSNDKNMMKAYNSGDPYLAFAKMSGAIPECGTKQTHKALRDLYKQCCLAIQYGSGAERLSITLNISLAHANELIQQHQSLYPRYWSWQENVITQAKLSQKIVTRFGWNMKVRGGNQKEDMTLGNFLMQSTGADILRVACYLLNEAGITIICPIHDAIMIQETSNNINSKVLDAVKIMQKASEIVIGKPLRVEAKTIIYPDRYIDDKGKATWERVSKILVGIQDGTIQPDEMMMGSKWFKHAAKLERMSKNNLTNWYDGLEEDMVDWEAYHDSSINKTENKKNLKGMYKEFLI